MERPRITKKKVKVVLHDFLLSKNVKVISKCWRNKHKKLEAIYNFLQESVKVKAVLNIIFKDVY